MAEKPPRQPLGILTDAGRQKAEQDILAIKLTSRKAKNIGGESGSGMSDENIAKANQDIGEIRAKKHEEVEGNKTSPYVAGTNAGSVTPEVAGAEAERQRVAAEEEERQRAAATKAKQDEAGQQEIFTVREIANARANAILENSHVEEKAPQSAVTAPEESPLSSESEPKKPVEDQEIPSAQDVANARADVLLENGPVAEADAKAKEGEEKKDLFGDSFSKQMEENRKIMSGKKEDLVNPMDIDRGKVEEAEAKARVEATVRKENEEAAVYFANRSKELDKKSEGFGAWVGKSFHLLGERYNKLGWKTKLAVGFGLGAGAASFAGVSALVAGTFAVGLGAQRLAGMASMYIKFEKHLQDTSEGTSKGFLGRREWYQKLFKGTSERQRKVTALVMAATYTGGMSYAIREAVHVASESSYGEAVHEWLKQHYPFGPAETIAPAAGVSAYHVEAPSHPVVGAAAGEVAAGATAPEMPDIPASDGHGYEYMMKRMWEQLQGKGLDADQYPEGSDIRQLLEADAGSIDKVVHQLAADPDHGFFNADGTSVQIDPGAHMTIDADGDINLGDAVHASPDSATTPEYHPEEHGAQTEELTQQQLEGNPAEPESDATPKELREKLRVMIDKFLNPTETPSDMRVHTSDQIPTDEVVSVSNDVTLDRPGEFYNVQDQPPIVEPATHVPSPEASHAPAPEVSHTSVVPEHLTVNAHHLPIDTAHANAFITSRGETVIFGGSVDEMAKRASELVEKDHSAVVYFSKEPDGILSFLKKTIISKTVWLEGHGIFNQNNIDTPKLNDWPIPTADDLVKVYNPEADISASTRHLFSPPSGGLRDE